MIYFKTRKLAREFAAKSDKYTACSKKDSDRGWGVKVL